MPAPKDKKLGRTTQGENREVRSDKGEGHKEHNGADRQTHSIDQKRLLRVEKTKRGQ